MYKIRKTALLFLMLLLVAYNAYSQKTLDIKIHNIEKNSGKIVVEIYNDESSWLNKPFQRTLLPTDEDSKTASFAVPLGTYAVSVYQDANGNGELDRSFIGIPKEPVAFGNNHKPFGKPKFEAALIEYTSAAKPQELALYEVF